MGKNIAGENLKGLNINLNPSIIYITSMLHINFIAMLHPLHHWNRRVLGELIG